MIRYLLITFYFFSIGLAVKSQSNIDVLHYKYNISLSDTSDKIYGLATIYFKTIAKTEFIEFDLKEINNLKGMKITDLNTPQALDIRHTASPTHIIYNHQNDKVKITLPHKLNVGDYDTLAIEYSGIPADGLIISKNKYGHRTFFADNWPNRGHNWIPCHDDPSDKATVDFIVTAPQHYQVVANGLLIEETTLPGDKKITHWKEDIPISTKVMVIGAADFAVNLSGTINNCIPVYSWVYPEDREKGFYDYAQAVEILPWYINNVGPYAYKKLANVESKTIFGGLENANTIFYSEKSITGDRESESLLAHEIAHQWFGNSATEKSFAHLWLSEGFATYMTILYMENKYGKDTAINMLKEDRKQVIAFGKTNKLPVINYTKDYMQLLNPNSYQKGGWVLHMLRRELGDSIFWQSIRLYYSTYGGKTADSDDLRQIFETVSGKVLKQFFQQWLTIPVNPNLEIKWKYDQAQKKILITITQLQPSIPFEFPLEIALVTGQTKKQILKINVAKQTETFSFSTDSNPVKIIADPNTSLLFESTIREEK